MEPDDPSGDSGTEMDLFVQQEVKDSRSAHHASGFVGVEIKHAGRDNERFQAKTKKRQGSAGLQAWCVCVRQGCVCK